MSDTFPALLRMVFAAVALFVVTTIVSMPLSASAGSYESCLGSCAIPSSANSPACTARRAACANPSGSAPSSQHYGAIAYSASTTKSGSSWGFSTQRGAESRAIHECILAAKGAGTASPMCGSTTAAAQSHPVTTK